MGITETASANSTMLPRRGFGRDMVENWAEVAWAMIDQMRHDAIRTKYPHPTELAERAVRHVADVKRPPTASFDHPPVIELQISRPAVR